MDPLEISAEKGIETIFHIYDNNAMQKILVTKHYNLLHNRCDNMPYLSKYTLFKTIITHNPALFNLEYWQNLNDKIYDLLCSTTGGFDLSANHKLFTISAKIKEKYADVDWTQIFEKSSKFDFRGNELLDLSLNKILSLNQDFLIDFLHSTKICELSYATRLKIYRAAILSGIVDLRIARKMRSDASELVSHGCLVSLFESQEKYKNFSELVIQFADTRYRDVAYYLVEKVTDDQLPFLIGIKLNGPMKALEKRMSKVGQDRAGS